MTVLEKMAALVTGSFRARLIVCLGMVIAVHLLLLPFTGGFGWEGLPGGLCAFLYATSQTRHEMAQGRDLAAAVLLLALPIATVSGDDRFWTMALSTGLFFALAAGGCYIKDKRARRAAGQGCWLHVPGGVLPLELVEHVCADGTPLVFAFSALAYVKLDPAATYRWEPQYTPDGHKIALVTVQGHDGSEWCPPVDINDARG
jgi:hypothetical protein